MKKKYSISLVVPAYNEEGNLGIFVSSAVPIMRKLSKKFEMIIVDDGSKDKTPQIANKLAKKYKEVRVIHHKTNKGYGEAQKTGFKHAKYELVSLVPSDNQFHVSDFKKYLELIDDADIVMGVRLGRKESLMRRINAKIYVFAIALLFWITMYGDIDWVKLYRKKVLDSINIESHSAFVDAEIIIKASKKGYRVKEVLVKHYPRLKGKPTGANLKVVFKQLSELFKFYLKYFGKKF